jgi:hypothetical protein
MEPTEQDDLLLNFIRYTEFEKLQTKYNLHFSYIYLCPEGLLQELILHFIFNKIRANVFYLTQYANPNQCDRDLSLNSV